MKMLFFNIHFHFLFLPTKKGGPSLTIDYINAIQKVFLSIFFHLSLLHQFFSRFKFKCNFFLKNSIKYFHFYHINSQNNF